MELKTAQNIEPGINKVVVKLKKFNNKVTLSNGMELRLDTQFEVATHVQVVGEVFKPPQGLYFNPLDRENSLEHLVDQRLEVGDIVYIDYLAVILALAGLYDKAPSYPDPKWIRVGDDIYVFIRYEDIFFAKRGKDIIMLNGYCIASPIESEVCRSERLLLPNEVRYKVSPKFARMEVVGERMRDFVDDYYDDEGTYASGDIVWFSDFANQRVEYTIHQTMFESSRDYIVIHRKWILGKGDCIFGSMIENGSIK